MSSNGRPVLRAHKLKYIPNLTFEAGFLEKKFTTGCSMMQCNATCCRQGVMVDIAERDRILKHAGMIQKYMEPHQNRDPKSWFESEVEEDQDFPSGAAVGTTKESYGCTFLDRKGLCVLQKAAVAEGMPKFSLKPFFCVAYPVTIESHELITDDADFTNRKECCSTVGKEGALTVLDVCSEELEFMLGKEGLEELKTMKGK